MKVEIPRHYNVIDSEMLEQGQITVGQIFDKSMTVLPGSRQCLS